MVKNRHFLGIAIVSSLTSAIACADSPIQSVRIGSDTTVRIKPCEPIFVILHITADSSAGQVSISGIVDELIRSVVVEYRDSGVRVHNSEGYPVAWLFPDEQSVRMTDDGNTLFQTVMLLYWHTPKNAYLFSEPGAFRVLVGSYAQLDVMVEQPTHRERELITEMQDLGPELAMFVLGPDGKQVGVLARRVEQMLKQYPDTAYTKHLTIPLGIAKLRNVKREAQKGPDFDAETYRREKAEVVRRYFEPYCMEELKSPVQAAGAMHLAEELLSQLKARSDDDDQESAAARRQAKTLLEKVKASPYSLDFRSKVAYLLKALED